MRYFRRDSMVEAWEFTGKVEDLPVDVQRLIKDGHLVIALSANRSMTYPLLKGDYITLCEEGFWARPGRDFNQEYLAYDDPELDCTPYEHPAFTRGSDWVGYSIIRAIREAMANPDQPHHYGSKELTALVAEIQALCPKKGQNDA